MPRVKATQSNGNREFYTRPPSCDEAGKRTFPDLYTGTFTWLNGPDLNEYLSFDFSSDPTSHLHERSKAK